VSTGRRADHLLARGFQRTLVRGDLGQVNSRQSSALGLSNDRRDAAIGLQLTIPLFRGFERHYRNREARAKIATSAAALEVAQQRISLDVWTQYSGLRTETETLLHTTQLVAQSKEALAIVSGRYRSGVGNMTEVLNAMSAYAGAQDQHIDATTRWKTARLGLAAGLGHLGFWDLE